MLSSFKTFPFKRLLINLPIFSAEIIGLILNTLCSIIICISLKSTIPIFEKNLATKMLTFIVLLSIKGSLVDLLRSNK